MPFPTTPVSRAPDRLVLLRRDGQYVSVCPLPEGLAETFVTTRRVPSSDDGRVLTVPTPLL
jgi:hypothetical protein